MDRIDYAVNELSVEEFDILLNRISEMLNDYDI